MTTTPTPTRTGAFKVRAKTSEVKEYHYNDDKPGKPLRWLIPGGLIALASIGLIIYIAYQTWFNQTMDADRGLPMILLLAPFYIGGVYMFSYGYELYDQKKALRLTAIIVFVTVAFVVIIAVLFALFGNSSSSSGSSKSGSSSSGGKSDSGSSSSSSQGSGGGSHLASPSVSSTSHSGGSGTILDPIIFVGGGGTRTVTETREVIKEVPIAPMPITCPACARSYVPADNKFACPNCGTATPQNLIEQSQM
jgi:hypothetical protein